VTTILLRERAAIRSKRFFSVGNASLLFSSPRTSSQDFDEKVWAEVTSKRTFRCETFERITITIWEEKPVSHQNLMAASPPAILINETRLTRKRSKTTKTSSTTPWTAAEDAILRAQVQDAPEFNWRQIYAMIPTRDPKQIIERWSRVVNPALKKGSWSSAEDATITRFASENGPTPLRTDGNSSRRR
jgi:hypothetical protein